MSARTPSYSGWFAAIAFGALLSGGMAMAGPNGPVRMSGLKVAGLAGYEVQDRTGLRVGTIARIERDAEGRTRWLRVHLDGGGEARVASFRADLDVAQKKVSLRLSQDLLIARALMPARAAISSPSI